MPQQVDITPEDFPLVNQGRIFTPFWGEPIVAKPGARGGANWPPSSYDPTTNYFYVCATDAANVFKGGEEDEKITVGGSNPLAPTNFPAKHWQTRSVMVGDGRP